MPFQPVDSLKSRTFIGLLIAQFLAAFNDQAIHASAMFFAIHHKTLTEANAISLMPILFYAPWAIFCTLAGWLADRYSKRQSLVFWKIAEVGITLTALFGFWLGSVHHGLVFLPSSFLGVAVTGGILGPWLVLSTVFLMGTHSAFFVPAKYGAMPEILPAHLLSKGNGLLESLSFLAVILGTVSGGILSYVFKGQEYVIGIILLTLAVIGAGASFLIQKMPAANPTRPFPRNLFKPLFDNLRVMLRSKPLALAVLGIAFFTFVVAFMRGTMYMHGETRNPRWTELHTSIVVGVVALGVGLGSPLAGFLSGGKIELGLVPLGAVGMILALLMAALTLNTEVALVACLIAIGFFTGFYIVPLFTLLQHRAPKASKGDLLASSNFINVVGAIAASILFKVLVIGGQLSGVTPSVPVRAVARGRLEALDYEQGRPAKVIVENGRYRPDRPVFERTNRQQELPDDDEAVDRIIIEQKGDPEPGNEVVVGRYELRRGGHRVVYFLVEPDLGKVGPDVPLREYELDPAYNNEPLTRFLFLGAALMTAGILFLLCRQMPDFFVRALLWLRSRGRYRLQVIGLHRVPTDGPVILATNCERLEDCLNVVAATDRYTRFILFDRFAGNVGPVLGYLARRTDMLALPDDADPRTWAKAVEKGARTLKAGNIVGLPAERSNRGEATFARLETENITAGIDRSPPRKRDHLLDRLRDEQTAILVPVYCGEVVPNGKRSLPSVRVVIGDPLDPDTSVPEIQQAIDRLSRLPPDVED